MTVHGLLTDYSSVIVDFFSSGVYYSEQLPSTEGNHSVKAGSTNLSINLKENTGQNSFMVYIGLGGWYISRIVGIR